MVAVGTRPSAELQKEGLTILLAEQSTAPQWRSATR
jgi:hypothetical protein